MQGITIRERTVNISKIYADAKAAIEQSSGTYFLFQIDPDVEDFCVDECFRLAQQDTRKPADRADLKQLPKWQQLCAWPSFTPVFPRSPRNASSS